VPEQHQRGELAPNLSVLRRQAGLSQSELAVRAKIALITLRRLESGQRGDRSSLEALALALSKELGQPISRWMLVKPQALPSKRVVRGQQAPNLRFWRLRSGLSQAALAAQAGVSIRTIQYLEAGHPGHVSKIEALAGALSKALGEPLTRKMLLFPLPVGSAEPPPAEAPR
jgi:transcriptional regulator with XRE-family HTH domain